MPWASGRGAAMDAALARLNRAEEDVAALREAIKVDCQARDMVSQMQKFMPPIIDSTGQLFLSLMSLSGGIVICC